MQYDHSLKSVSDITTRLRDMVRQKFPAAEIQAERDFQFERHFGYNKRELIAPISPSVAARIKGLCFLDLEIIAKRHGFDIEVGRDEFSVDVPYITFDDDDLDVVYADEEDDDEEDGEEEKDAPLDYEYMTELQESYPEKGSVTQFAHEWIEMMIAKDMKLFPTTPEQLQEVQYQREAKKFQERAERERHRPKDTDQERQKVFGAIGTSREFKPGTTVVTARKGQTTAREVKVEVVKRRRFTS